ncbi:tudor domain-containing protein 5 isoform X3 [Ascaphus truei]|uniref:tudor domain-containing protein 5 isoform X3 n=1 Tax=Ascaphus truei TaxID=8439 RepID=UPI003F5A8D57
MDEEQRLQSVRKAVRSLLIASKKGMRVSELEKDYRMMIGSQLPLRVLGYRSTMELLMDMPDVVNISSNGDGTVLLSAVVDEATKGMADLISRQNTPRVRKKPTTRHVIPRCHTDLVRRVRVSPVLPATLKSDLRDLLSYSPVLLSDLEKAFFSRFGRSFQYSRYGFFSILEVLRSISDIVLVEDTRAGSMLKLRNSQSGGTLLGTFVKQNIAFHPANIHKPPSNVPKQSLTQPQNPDKKQSIQNISLSAEHQHSGIAAPLQMSPMSTEPPNLVVNPSLQNPPTQTEIQNIERNISLPNPPLVSPENQNTGRSLPLKRDTLPAEPPNPVKYNSLVKHMHPAEAVTAGTLKSAADTEDENVASSVADMDRSLQLIEKKLEKEMRLCLAQKGAGGSISPDLRREIIHIVNRHSEGPLVSQLPVLFKGYTGKDLPFKELGFMSVMELVGSLGDILYLESTADGQDWRLFDAETKYKTEDDGLLTVANRHFLSGNSPPQSSKHVKPAGIQVSQAYINLWWGPLKLSSSTEREIPPDAVKEQRLRCLPHMEQGSLLGVIIENISTPSQFYVRLCSKDTSEKLEDMMIEMRNCYMNLPAQAVPSSLACVRPAKDQWSTPAIKRFQQLCGCGPLVGLVLQYVQDVLCLFLCDTSSDADIYLHQLLVTAGHAVGTKESEPHRVLHQLNPFVLYLKRAQELSQDKSRKTQSSAQNENSPAELPYNREPVLQVKEEAALGMPYLEALPTGTDLWDENWPFTGNVASLSDTCEPSNVNNEKQQHEKLSQEPSKVCEESDDAGLRMCPLEEFYISLIKSKTSPERSDMQQSLPARDQPTLQKLHLPATEQCQVFPAGAEKPCVDKSDFCLDGEPTYYQQSHNMVNPFLGFQKLQIPRSATTVTLGPSARLTTAGSLVHWVPDLGKV